MLCHLMPIWITDVVPRQQPIQPQWTAGWVSQRRPILRVLRSSRVLNTTLRQNAICANFLRYVLHINIESLHLPVHGTKDRLIERHRQWVNLYNANLDATPEHRESISTLKKMLRQWEQSQDSPATKKLVSSENQVRAWLVRDMRLTIRKRIATSMLSWQLRLVLRYRKKKPIAHHRRKST